MRKVYATSQDKGRAYKAIHEALKAEVYPEPTKRDRKIAASERFRANGE